MGTLISRFKKSNALSKCQNLLVLSKRINNSSGLKKSRSRQYLDIGYLKGTQLA